MAPQRNTDNDGADGGPRQQAVRVFVSYSHKDAALLEELESHLALLRRQGVVNIWSDRRIDFGADWHAEISSELESADLILMLVSADLLASDYVYEREAQLAFERHEQGQARVVPIILRHADWQNSPFGKYQALPRGGRPITSWRNRDEAWVNVVEGIRLVCDEIRGRTAPQVNKLPKAADTRSYPLFEVFKASGVPAVTFVEPDSFPRLKMSIAQAGRGVVIQGPSGIGKTTALRTAISEVYGHSSPTKVEVLSARRPDEASRLLDIERWHRGIVAVDDFHRLEPRLKQHLADYLKDLADRELPDRKLVIVGIPRTGQKLVDLAFDLATRIDVYSVGKVRDSTVIRMIEIGERALNIQFARKSDIARGAAGSLNIAQLLCFHLAADAGVLSTELSLKRIDSDVQGAVENVLEQIGLKFSNLVRTFASFGTKRDLTCMEMLQELARTEDGFLSLPHLRDTRPDLAAGIDRFVKHNYIRLLHERSPESQHHLLFDESVPALIIDDPQLTFFLLQSSPGSLLKAAGKVHGTARSKVFISYSHADAKWLERLRVHLRPLERDGTVDLWDDTRIAGGSVWRDDIAKAIDAAKVAVLLVTADFLASDFIADNELPPLLAAAAKDGLVIIPVIVSPSRFLNTESLSKFQTVNPPSKPLIAMNTAAQEDLLVRLSQTIEDALAA